METPQPALNGSVKNHLRRSRSEGSLSPDLSPKKRLLSHELNVDETRGSSAKKRKLFLELNVAAQEWTVFRLLVPTKDDDAVNRYKRQIHHFKSQYEKKNVEVDFHCVAAGVGVVMVSAKRDSRRSIDDVVNAFDEVHRYFLHSMPCENNCLTRLLVPASHAKRLIILYTILSGPSCLTIYLTDNLSVFFPGDVIVDVEGQRMCVRKKIKTIVSLLGEFKVDESMMADFKDGNGIRPSYREIHAPENASSGVKAQRKIMLNEFTRIPLSYIDYLTGEDGENIEKIRKSSPAASVYLESFTPKEVCICIEGEKDSEVGDATDALEKLIPEDKKIVDGKHVFGSMCGSETIVFDDDMDMTDLPTSEDWSTIEAKLTECINMGIKSLQESQINECLS